MRCSARCSGKFIETEETLQRGVLHPRSIREPHVIFNQGENLVRFVIRESKAPANLRAYSHTHFHVPVEANAVGSYAKGRRLANVVKQRAPGQRQGAAGLQLLQQHQRVNPHVALGMKLRGLCDTLHPRDFRKHLDEKVGFVQQFEMRAARGLR